MFQLNVRGISDLQKFNKICAIIISVNCNFDIILFTEVKLKSSYPVQLLNMLGYSRFTSLRSEEGGGGIVVFIKSSIQVESLTTLSNKFEKLCAFLIINDIKLRMITYYRAPNQSNVNDFLADLEMEASASNVKTFIAGDMNIQSAVLSVRPSSSDLASRQYEKLLMSYNFKVTNNLPTRPVSGRNIDHFATNFTEKHSVSNFVIEIDSSISDHCIIVSTINLLRKPSRNLTTITKSTLDYQKLSKNFPDVQEQISLLTDPNDAANAITAALQEAMEASTTVETFKIKHPERINKSTSIKSLSLIATKDRLLNKHRKKPSNVKIKNKLAQVTISLDNSLRNDFKNYIQKKVSTSDSKKMWKNLNEILGRNKDSNPQHHPRQWSQNFNPI